MNRNSIDWRGYIPAITTPFSVQGELDIELVDQHFAWLAREKMHGVIIAGTQGEWFSLSPAEKTLLFQRASELLKGKMTILAGCNGYNSIEVLENAEMAKQYGFDGILLTPPPYMMPTEREIFEFYREVNQSINLPICVYNWPPGTNIDMSLPLLRRLAELDKVVAIKNSTSDMRHFLEVFFALKDQVRVFGIPMNDLGISLVQQHNADGTMGAGAVLGREQPDFYNAIWEGNIEEAKRLGERDATLMREWFNRDLTGKLGSSQAIFKEALNQQGLYGGYPRKPLLPLEQESVDKLRGTLLRLERI